MKIIEPRYLENLFDQLKERGYNLFVPVVHDGAIVYDQVECFDELPICRHDQQEKGAYRLRKSGEASCIN